jgi:hypothetical protein
VVELGIRIDQELVLMETPLNVTYAEAFGALNSRHDAGGRKVTLKGAVGSGRKWSRQSESRSEHMYAQDKTTNSVVF